MMQSDGVNSLICLGYNDDVVDAELACYEKWKDQPIELVQGLTGTIDEKCESVFAYLTERVYYKLDNEGDQYIKSLC